MTEMITSQDKLEERIQQWGFMPFFKNAVTGFSIEEIMAPDMLFGDHGFAEESGAWQWKGPIIGHWEAAYGKFFAGKAGFISLDWLPDFMNVRRHAHPLRQYPADARRILTTLQEHESMLSKQLKTASGFTLERKKTKFNPENPERPLVNHRNGTSFDALIAQLQMGTHVCIADFEYARSKEGTPYGWGVARYCTPEAMYEFDYHKMVEGRTPAESQARILHHLRSLFPDATDKAWKKSLGE